MSGLLKDLFWADVLMKVCWPGAWCRFWRCWGRWGWGANTIVL